MAVISPIETANSHDLTVPPTTAPRVCQTLTVLVERACNSRSTAVVLCLCILPSIAYDRKYNTSHEDIGDLASWSHTAICARYIGESLIDVLNPDCPSCGAITASCSVSVESRCKSVALIRVYSATRVLSPCTSLPMYTLLLSCLADHQSLRSAPNS